MMTKANIIDVSEESFEFEVVHYSNQVPVVIDFWAPWCVPCGLQSSKLKNLAQEADGAFRLARVNVDEQMKLAEKLKVTKLPAIKAFVDGRLVAEYTGALSETSLRMFLDRILPKANSLLLQKGLSLIVQGDYKGADVALAQYVVESHGSPQSLLAYSRALLFLGQTIEALAILEQIPASPEYQVAQRLRKVAEAVVWGVENENPLPNDPLEPAFERALLMIRNGKIEMALDGLLDILRKDRHYRNDEAREIYLGLLELLSEDYPETRTYRADLNAVLF